MGNLQSSLPTAYYLNHIPALETLERHGGGKIVRAGGCGVWMLNSVFQAGPCVPPGVRPAQDPANQKSQHRGGRTHQVSIIGEELLQVDECWGGGGTESCFLRDP